MRPARFDGFAIFILYVMGNKELYGYVKPMIAVACNLLLAYAAFMLCRIEFMVENWQCFADDMTVGLFFSIIRGGLLFDTSAILYTNIIYVVLALFPIHLKDTDIYAAVTKWVYVITNTLAVCAGLADSVVFQHTGQRMTYALLQSEAGGAGVGSLVLGELLSHWYLILVAIAMAFAMWKLYTAYRTKAYYRLVRYYIWQLALIICAAPLVVAGMKGSFNVSGQHLEIEDASRYVNKQIETSLVLNTPFTLYRSLGSAATQGGDAVDEARNGAEGR